MKTLSSILLKASLQCGTVNLVIETFFKESYNSPKKKIHLKSECVDWSVVTGAREPILFSFVREKLPGYQVLYERT